MYYLNSRYYDPVIGRFLNADTVEVLTADPYSLAGKNMFAYCDNNPVARMDKKGEFWNVIIGAVVGGVVSGLIAGYSSYKQTGQVDWGSIAINAAVGAASGAIAATGLGAITQAGLTAVISGAGNFAEQCYTNGISDVNYTDVVTSAVLGGATSLMGTGAGKVVGNKFEKAGATLVSKGRDKLLTGVVRRSVGQSHSSLIRQGNSFVSQGLIKINTARGISSVIGTGISGVTTFGYNGIKSRIFGW